jgi:cell fate (sporulation/competence/biofilm development) regulator YmcA (YheA/YmcA/DUF963 family)
LKTEIEKLIASLKQELLNTPEMVRFFQIQKEIQDNDELMKWNKTMREHQRLMTKNVDDEIKYSKHKKQYEQYQIKYDNHPLVVNYRYQKEIVYDLLNQLKTIIE